MRSVAIVLAGGDGTRMHSSTKKQYLMLKDKPVLWYSLNEFQHCPMVNEIVLVCGEGETEECRREFVDQYRITKIKTITEGGRERFHSVHRGLKAAKDCDYVLIHDGARPFIDQEMLGRIFETLMDHPACVVGMPVKDTMKLRDPEGYIEETIPREKLWMIQTPQSFSYPLIREAYDAVERQHVPASQFTDDAMVLEYNSSVRIKLIKGSYDNIKITTPEDFSIAESIVNREE